MTVVVDVCGRCAVTVAIRTRSGPPSTSASRSASSAAAFTGRRSPLEKICSRPALWNRNRNWNRRNRNFMTSETGIGTVTVINYGSGTGTRYNILYLITFIKKIFSFTFTINLLKFINFFFLKQLNM